MGDEVTSESQPSGDGKNTALAKSVEEACKSDGSTTLDTKQCGCDKATIVITIQRSNDATDSTLGTFDVRTEGKTDQGTVSGHTLEPRKGNYERVTGRGKKDYPIPAGTYSGHLKTGSGKNGNVPDHANEAVEVDGVTGFGDILLHVGNTWEDTEGCILLGSSASVQEEQVKKKDEKAEAKKDEKAEAKKDEKAEAKKDEKAEAKKDEKAEAKKDEKAEAKKDEGAKETTPAKKGSLGASVTKNKELLDYIAKVQKTCGKSTTTIKVVIKDPATAETRSAETKSAETKSAETKSAATASAQ